MYKKEVFTDDVLEEQESEEHTEQVEDKESNEEETDKDDEQVTDDEGWSVADYQTKIEELDAQLSEYRADSLDAFRRNEMKSMHYTDEQVERYSKHVTGETEA